MLDSLAGLNIQVTLCASSRFYMGTKPFLYAGSLSIPPFSSPRDFCGYSGIFSLRCRWRSKEQGFPLWKELGGSPMPSLFTYGLTYARPFQEHFCFVCRMKTFQRVLQRTYPAAALLSNLFFFLRTPESTHEAGRLFRCVSIF